MWRPLVGFVIGWLAEKFYTLLKGKQTKVKIVILVVAVIFGVVLGNLLAEMMGLMELIDQGYWPGATALDVPSLLAMCWEIPEYRSAVIRNVIMGLVFAGLGVFATLKQSMEQVADSKYIEL